MRKFKSWFLNTFFKKQLYDIHDSYLLKIGQIEYDAHKKMQNIDTVHIILSDRNNTIVGESDNKNKDHVFVVQRIYNNNIEFMLYSSCYKTIHPRIMAIYYNGYEGEPVIKIQDILVEDNNVGNGSILMSYFLDYCKAFTDAKYITGYLSPVDSGHFDRLEHFYKKHGFMVTLNENRTSGSIKYEIKL